MKNLTDAFKLKNGVEIPCVGYGTWQTPDGEVAKQSVIEALKLGYRHIDTAAAYGNEKSVGEAIKESGVKREDIFVTSKLWNKCRGYETTIAAFNKTLEDLGLEYLDLYLIHWPANEKQFKNWNEINVDTWKAMVELYKAGKIKSIGVSNFRKHHLASLLEFDVIPMVNQIEYHPGYMQEDLVEYCKSLGILVEGWSPLGTGRVLQNETLIKVAEKYSRSVAQICIKWALQKDILPLPKSVTPSRIEENAKVFDFELSAEDIKTIDNIGECGFSSLDPDEVEF